MKISIICIGDELLIGQVLNTNAHWLAQNIRFNQLGDVINIQVCSDNKLDIEQAIKCQYKKADLIIITGGLGPTKDDITKIALADLMNQELIYNQAYHLQVQEMVKMYKNVKLTKAQFYFPENTQILENKVGTAPGMLFNFENIFIISIPGVPSEMKHIFKQHIHPFLLKHTGEKVLSHLHIRTIGIGEGKISQMIENIENNLPAHISLSFLPEVGEVKIRINGVGNLQKTLDQEMAAIKKNIVSKIYPYIYSFKENDTISQNLGKILLNKKLKIGAVESCTGGKIASLICENEGASTYFNGGIVSYTNEIKNNLVGVQKRTLDKKGAVSEHVIKQMVKMGLKKLNVDLVIATTGFLGKTGGTEKYPNGTVLVAVGNSNKIKIYKLFAGNTRTRNMEYIAKKTINISRLFLLEENNF